MIKRINESTKITISKLIGKAVYTSEGGKFLGKIDKVILNHQSKKIDSLIINNTFWGNKIYQVMVSSIIKVGEDVLLINNIKNCYQIEKIDEVENTTFKNILENNIITGNGDFIGTISDITISTKTFKVIELILNHNRSIKVDPKLIVLGKDEIIIPSIYKTKIIQHPSDSLLKKFINFKINDEIQSDKNDSMNSNLHRSKKEIIEEREMNY